MNDEDIQMVFFKTIANRTRFTIVNTLKEKAKNVNQICKDTGYEQSLVSHNLRMLKQTGFVDVKQEGKYHVYYLEKENVGPMLEAIQRHVQKQKKSL